MQAFGETDDAKCKTRADNYRITANDGERRSDAGQARLPHPRRRRCNGKLHAAAVPDAVAVAAAVQAEADADVVAAADDAVKVAAAEARRRGHERARGRLGIGPRLAVERGRSEAAGLASGLAVGHGARHGRAPAGLGALLGVKVGGGHALTGTRRGVRLGVVGNQERCRRRGTLGVGGRAASDSGMGNGGEAEGNDDESGDGGLHGAVVYFLVAGCLGLEVRFVAGVVEWVLA